MTMPSLPDGTAGPVPTRSAALTGPADEIRRRSGQPQTIFVLGDPMARITRRPMSATGRAEWALLAAYRVAQTQHWGVVYLTVMVRA